MLLAICLSLSGLFRASSAISELIDVGPRRKIQMTKGFSHRRVARIFCGEERLGSEDTNLYGGSGGMLPRENFRNVGLPWTTFRAFLWWRKRI